MAAKPTPKPVPYWKKEEATRSKMDYRNAGYSIAEKKAMAAKKMVEANKKRSAKGLIPFSPTK